MERIYFAQWAFDSNGKWRARNMSYKICIPGGDHDQEADRIRDHVREQFGDVRFDYFLPVERPTKSMRESAESVRAH